MARQLDATAFGVLTKLIDKVTDKHETHQDAAALQQIKALCKQSDENITWISSALLHRLKEEHSQTRLHVVNLADQLFQRSKAFRNHLTANFTDFLELSLGFKHDKPLPGPANTANQLRDRTLEVVEQWNDKFGSTYKQVSLGYNYLKNNMAMRFPEVRARAAAAAAESQERRVRSQALLQDKFQHICAGFEGHVADMKAALTQIAEGFTIVEASGQASAAAAVPAAVVQDAAVLQGPEDEIAWEAVETAAPAADVFPSAAAKSNAGEEGLSAYAMDSIPEDLLQQADTAPNTASEGIDRAWVSLKNPEPAVIETLQGLGKVVSNRHLPRVQGWLKVFVKVDVGEVGSPQHAQREHMLRSSIDLQTQLKQSQQKLEALSQQLAVTSSDAQVASPSAYAPKAQAEPDHAVASGQANSQNAVRPDQASALMEALFGSDEEGSTAQGLDREARVKSQAGTQAKAGQQHEETTAAPAQSAGTAAVGSQQAVARTSQGVLPVAADARHMGAKLGGQPNVGSDSGPGQQMMDPAAPKRSISFSNSLRRRPASFIQQRRDAFDEAADAAVSHALAQRSMTATQAADLASQPFPEAAEYAQEAPESMSATPVLTSEKQNHGMTGVQPQQALRTHTDAHTGASAPNPATPVRLGPATQGPQGLPSGRVQSASMPDPASTKKHGSEEAQHAPQVVTRASQAEVAPKLRRGSRLAASMAKMAASKQRGTDQQETPAAAPLEQHEDVQKRSAIPEDVKRALLAKAPVVAHGHDLVYWDTNNARALVNARGMEYQNHWGAHDPDVELPSEQLNAFFGTRAEYWSPSAKPSALSGQPQRALPGANKQPAGSPLGIPGSQDGSSARQTAVPAAAAMRGSSAVGNERAQRAADRAHNEAVIASTDQQVAQALADEEAQAAVKASSGQGRGTKRKPQPTVRERLAKKLLSGRARGQTLGEVESVADERFQEVNSNRWQATRFP